MKIAILTSGILPIPAVQGGAVENLVDFYLAYNEQKKLHDITIYSVANSKTQNHPALLSDVNHYYYINTSSIKAKIRRFLYKLSHKNDYYNYFIEYYFEQACKHIEQQSYDSIIMENRPGYAYKLSKRTQSKLVLHLHNDLLNEYSKHHTEIFNSLYKIITVSEYIKSKVCTIQDSHKVQTIHNGIDLKSFTIHPLSNISRQNIGLSENDFILVYSGRINKDKGVTQLIDAMLHITNITNIKLLILGSSFFDNAKKDNDFIISLKSKSLEIADRIKFTGFIPYAQVPDYLKLADIAVLPSMWDEPFGLTIAEAQAVGLPIITTNCGGIPEVASDKNAIMLNNKDHFIENLANAILDLYQHPEKRKAMSQASLERSKLFDKDRYAKEFFEAIETI